MIDQGWCTIRLSGRRIRDLNRDAHPGKLDVTLLNDVFDMKDVTGFGQLQWVLRVNDLCVTDAITTLHTASIDMLPEVMEFPR